MIKFDKQKHLKIMVVFLSLTMCYFLVSCSSDENFEEKHLQYKQINHIVDGLVSANNLKLYVTEYMYENGVWPENNAALNLAPPLELARKALKKIEILNGKIILTYNEKSGVDGGVITLTPVVDFELRWDCQSSTYKEIETYYPGCRYINLPPNDSQSNADSNNYNKPNNQ